MLCPTCGADDTRVIDSRPAEAGESIRRRRVCEACESRFTTYERIEPQLMVRKRDGHLEPFSAAKLVAGMSASLADRSISGSAVEELAAEVEAAVRQQGAQVKSDVIGREVLDRLKELDEVAYLRFASVYKDFKDAADFEKEVAALESSGQ
ncbi:MAG: transcriptional repressor NrdR [Actinobacteria bacterium]|nr:MAG: transcriptional repressor NrdR [Actinomycetota bacterium]